MFEGIGVIASNPICFRGNRLDRLSLFWDIAMTFDMKPWSTKSLWTFLWRTVLVPQWRCDWWRLALRVRVDHWNAFIDALPWTSVPKEFSSCVAQGLVLEIPTWRFHAPPDYKTWPNYGYSLLGLTTVACLIDMSHRHSKKSQVQPTWSATCLQTICFNTWLLHMHASI